MPSSGCRWPGSRSELAASTRRESDLQALVVDLRRDREALQATIDRLAAELALARKGWLERLLEAVAAAVE